MRKFALVGLCPGFLFLLALCASGQSIAKHVFIVSIDGGKPSVIHESKMPTLEEMVRKGAYSWTAQTTFPSITLTSHTSMLTGVGPEIHKVLWNDWEPTRGMISSPTCLGIAKKTGLKTAMFVGKSKFIHFFVPKTLNEFSFPAYHAKTVAEVAAKYIVAEKPNLCFIHFADTDGAGHEFGWGSEQQKQAFNDVDVALKTVLQAIKRAGILNDSIVIVSADHGGHDKTHGSNSPDDMNIPWIAWGKAARSGYSITRPITTYDTAATALWLLGVPIPENWQGKPILSAFIKEN